MPLRTSHLTSSSLLRHGRILLPTTLSHLYHGKAPLTPSPQCLSCPLSSTAAAQNLPPNPHFVVQEFLMASCGFSPDKAAKVSKPLTHLKSPHKPDSVLLFLRQLGFDEAHIRDLVTWNPRLLSADVERTLKPKIKAYQDLGFTGPDLTQLISANPSTLRLTSILPKLEFLQTMLPAKEDLLKALRRDPTLLHSNPIGNIVPNASLLRECGVPQGRIATALLDMPWLLTRKPEAFRRLVDRIAGLEYPRGSVMFLYALHTVSKISKERFQAKLQLMKSFGWSEAEFLSAFRVAPKFLTLSEEKIRVMMGFLLGEAGYSAAYVAAHPLLLMFNLERRLVPRHRVLQILKSEGLLAERYALLSVAYYSEEEFLKRFVLKHIGKVPALQEIYQATCAGTVPV